MRQQEFNDFGLGKNWDKIWSSLPSEKNQSGRRKPLEFLVIPESNYHLRSLRAIKTQEGARQIWAIITHSMKARVIWV